MGRLRALPRMMVARLNTLWRRATTVNEYFPFPRVIYGYPRGLARLPWRLLSVAPIIVSAWDVRRGDGFPLSWPALLGRRRHAFGGRSRRGADAPHRQLRNGFGFFETSYQRC